MREANQFATFGEALQRFARECQLSFASLQIDENIDLDGLVRRVIDACPEPKCYAQQLLLRSVAVQTVIDFAAHIQVNESVDWNSGGLLSTLATTTDSDGFVKLFGRTLLAICTAASPLLRPRPGGRSHRHVSSAIEALERHSVKQTFDLPALARILGLSPSHLDHLLVHFTGHGFREHLRRVRLQRSVGFLSDPNLSIKEVSAATGYRSASEFDRQFRRHYGLTPTQWRDAAIAGACGLRDPFKKSW